MAWNRADTSSQSAARKPASKSPSAVKGAIAGVIVVALAVAAYSLLFSNGPEKPKTEKVEKKPAKISEVKPAAAPKAIDSEAPQEDLAKKARREMLAKMTKEERFNFIYEEMKKKPLDLEPTAQRAFKTGTEQMMSWIFTTKLGDMPPPPVAISVRDEAHMAEILIANNPVLEGDGEQVKEAKATVEQVKAELRKFLKEGGDVKDFLNYYRDQLMQANQEWRDCQKEVMKTVREDPAIAADFLKEVNARLAAKGIKPVKLNPHLREKLGIPEE